MDRPVGVREISVTICVAVCVGLAWVWLARSKGACAHSGPSHMRLTTRGWRPRHRDRALARPTSWHRFIFFAGYVERGDEL